MFGSTTSGKLLLMWRGTCHTHTEATLGMDGTSNNDSNNNNDNKNNGCMDVNGCDVKRTLWANPCRFWRCTPIPMGKAADVYRA